MITPRRTFGNQGEDAVTKWIIERGFTILARNYQTRMGEVDIIATKGEVVAFIEVKTRKSALFPISNTITITKQRRIAKAAISFVLQHKIRERVLRFDVATLTTSSPGEYDITYIENAFTV